MILHCLLFFSILKGKSLSLICGSLRWLFDEIQSWRNEYEELLKPIETKNESRYTNEILFWFCICFYFSSDDWLKRLMKRKEEETAREKRRVCSTKSLRTGETTILYQIFLFLIRKNWKWKLILKINMPMQLKIH